MDPPPTTAAAGRPSCRIRAIEVGPWDGRLVVRIVTKPALIKILKRLERSIAGFIVVIARMCGHSQKMVFQIFVVLDRCIVSSGLHMFR